MEEKYYEILRHYVNPNDCATVVKQLLSLHNIVGQSNVPKCTLCKKTVDININPILSYCDKCGRHHN